MFLKNNRGTWLLATTAMMASAGTAVPAFAQATQPSAAQVEEIIVTAQKRAENLQDVPITVTAISASALDAAATNSTRDLPALLPGLQFNQSLGSAQIYVRGVGQSLGQLGTEPPTSFYIDGVYLPQSHSGIFSFNNIEQISLLKGPQGTLFGRNATGGVLQVTTKAPSFDPKLEADIGLASYETVSGHIYATGGLSDDVAMSIAAYGSNQGKGITRNRGTGNEILETDSAGGQAKLLWRPGDATDITLMGLYNYNKGSLGVANAIFPGSLPPGGVPYTTGYYDINLSIDPYSRSEQAIGSLRIEHDFGGVRLSNLVAVHTLDEKTINVSNAIPFQTTPPAPGTRPSTWSDQDNTSTSWTNELVLQAPADQDFQWTVGFFFLHDRTNADFHQLTNAASTTDTITLQKTTSYAFFAQATKTILPNLRLTAGARYTMDKKSVSGQQFSGSGAPLGTYAAGAAAANPPFSTTKKENEPTYRVALDYSVTDDVLLYASFATGFKSGTYALNTFANAPTNPEYIDAWEAGVKSELFDRRLRLNLSAFYYDYTDLQLRAFIPPARNLVQLNAASARIKGIDGDFEAVLSSNLSFSGGFEILDAKYHSFPNFRCPVPSPSGGNPTSADCDLSGERMPRSPVFTGNIAPTYRIDLANGGAIRVSGNVYYNDGFNWSEDSRLKQKSYTSVSASIKWTSPGDRWSVDLWGRNLTKARIFGTAGAGNTDWFAPGAPRTVGATLGFRI